MVCGSILLWSFCTGYVCLHPNRRTSLSATSSQRGVESFMLSTTIQTHFKVRKEIRIVFKLAPGCCDNISKLFETKDTGTRIIENDVDRIVICNSNSFHWQHRRCTCSYNNTSSDLAGRRAKSGKISVSAARHRAALTPAARSRGLRAVIATILIWLSPPLLTAPSLPTTECRTHKAWTSQFSQSPPESLARLSKSELSSVSVRPHVRRRRVCHKREKLAIIDLIGIWENSPTEVAIILT